MNVTAEGIEWFHRYRAPVRGFFVLEGEFFTQEGTLDEIAVMKFPSCEFSSRRVRGIAWAVQLGAAFELMALSSKGALNSLKRSLKPA
ncbi:hypothetical protein [Cryobacterium sp. M91]|uniref:hypothetical protein n=1 Tax=Cryobacterium sp. M91 TaxID=2048294 RepID=UPI0011B09D8C|nr:hypothetical protein [Cryobacterium sp. M91]